MRWAHRRRKDLVLICSISILLISSSLANNKSCPNFNCPGKNATRCDFTEKQLKVDCGSASICLLATAGDVTIHEKAHIVTNGNCTVMFSVGGTFYMKQQSQITASVINITASVFTMEQDAVLNTTGRGYLAGASPGNVSIGASYGGSGGSSRNRDRRFINACPNNLDEENLECVETYNLSSTWASDYQNTIGSGGNARNVRGGGSIRVVASNSLSIFQKARIESNGDHASAGSSDTDGTGAGSGGSILLHSNAMSVHGIIQANGGNVVCSTDACFPAAGGGRIEVGFASSDWTSANISVSGGLVPTSPSVEDYWASPSAVQKILSEQGQSLVGAAGTLFQVTYEGLNKNAIVDRSLYITNVGHSIQGWAITPFSSADGVILDSVIIEHVATCATSELVLQSLESQGSISSQVIIRESARILMISPLKRLLIVANVFQLTYSSQLYSFTGITVLTDSFLVDVTSSIHSNSIVSIVAQENVEIAGNMSVHHSRVHLEQSFYFIPASPVSALMISGRTITMGGNIASEKILINAKDTIALTGNISQHTLPDVESTHFASICRPNTSTRFSNCGTIKSIVSSIEENLNRISVHNNVPSIYIANEALIPQLNYSCILQAATAIYIGKGQSVQSNLISNTSLLCADLIDIGSSSYINANGLGCPGGYGPGAGECASVHPDEENGNHSNDIVHIGGGGGYGGAGGGIKVADDLKVGGQPYGAVNPLGTVGSGGGCASGGSGGGLIKIESLKMILNGYISADGYSGGPGGGGGGSGGYIEIKIHDIISGQGNVSARGGNGDGYIASSTNTTSNTTTMSDGVAHGAGGGGGRLKLFLCEAKLFQNCALYYNGTSSIAGGHAISHALQGSRGYEIGKECPAGFTGIFCQQCPVGTFKAASGSQPCQVCEHSPENAHYTMKGSVSSECEWACDPGYSGIRCHTPFRQLLDACGGSIGFALALGSIVILTSLTGFLCRARRSSGYRRLADSKRERQKLLDGKEMKSSSAFWSIGCCLSKHTSSQHVGYPKLKESDLNDHVYRLHLSGDNSPTSPWKLELQPPEEIQDIIFEQEFTRLALKINSSLEWPRESRKSMFFSGGNWLYLVACCLCQPFASEIINLRKLKRLNILKRILCRYNHGFLKGPRARALLNSVKLGYSADLSLAYLEILYKENNFVSSPEVGKPRLPMVLLLSGCGTYESPYYLDAADLLVRSIPQYSRLTQFIDEPWIELVAELNARLRTVMRECLDFSLEPVVTFLERKNVGQGMSSHLGGLHLYLGKFWTSPTNEEHSFKLGLYLTMNDHRPSSSNYHHSALDLSSPAHASSPAIRMSNTSGRSNTHRSFVPHPQPRSSSSSSSSNHRLPDHHHQSLLNQDHHYESQSRDNFLGSMASIRGYGSSYPGPSSSFSAAGPSSTYVSTRETPVPLLPLSSAQGIREEALRMRTRTSSSDSEPQPSENQYHHHSTQTFPNQPNHSTNQPNHSTNGPASDHETPVLKIQRLDPTLPLPGLLLSSRDIRQSRQSNASILVRLKWIIYRHILPCNVRQSQCLMITTSSSSSWALVFALMSLLCLDLILLVSILVNLKCITNGEVDAECSASIMIPVMFILDPFALIIAPVLGIISLTVSTPTWLRKYSQYNALSMVNSVVCWIVCCLESQHLVKPWFSAPVPLVPLLSLLVKMAQASFVELYIAELETKRRRRGWRGLISDRDSDTSSTDGNHHIS